MTEDNYWVRETEKRQREARQLRREVIELESTLSMYRFLALLGWVGFITMTVVIW